MQIINIAGYKFVRLTALEELRAQLLAFCANTCLKGTILLSQEGINLSLAGSSEQINAFKRDLLSMAFFNDIQFHETFSSAQPFQQLKIKLKKEIITFGVSELDAVSKRAPELSPAEFKQWLDENRDMTILDTRNAYEVRFGTFKKAVNLNINDFGEFPDAVTCIEKHKPVVMFCTGGIRCEKAALHMLQQGYENVYQLDGGILGYFAEVGGEHYDGECFVFDERIALDTQLKPTNTIQCINCQGPVTSKQQLSSLFIPGISCPNCANQ